MTKRMAGAERRSRKRHREFQKLEAAIRHLESGGFDDHIAGGEAEKAEFKAVAIKKFKEQMEALIAAEIDEFPDLYERPPDGKLSLRGADNVVPLRPPDHTVH